MATLLGVLRRAVRRLPLSRHSHWSVPVAAGLVWVLVFAVGVPVLHRSKRAADAGRGTRVLAAPRAFASVSLPAGARTAPETGAVKRQATPPPVSPAKHVALLIGVNRSPGHRTLQGAVKDATNLQTALVQYGFPESNVVTLVDGAATTARILKELDRLADRSVEDGRAVFSFAGHTSLIGGVPHFVAGDGGRIPARTLAAKLARVRAPTWVALPTCYAGGYQLPGIVGPNRVATFSSAANRMSYELGPSGSWLILYMVEYAMLERQAPRSVESSFAYARRAIADINRDREPFMVDGYPGEFVLGTLRPPPPGTESYSEPTAGDGVSAPATDSEPEQTASGRRGPIRVCSGVRFGCNGG